MMFRVSPTLSVILAASILSFHGSLTLAQPSDNASVVRMVDAAVKARIDNVAGYTVTEHYAVFRSNDEIHPAAEMIVRTTYERNSGKSYMIVSQSGSTVMRNLVLNTILDNEKQMNRPGIRESAWITSANYEMKLERIGTEPLDGRECLLLTLIPKRKAPYLFEGTLWVDSKDGSIVQLQGTASKNSSMVTGPTQVVRQYANIGGSSEATHVRAVSNSSMFGETIVKIDYRDYQIQLRPTL
jgi:outer membrane lipoprotein-sorting protein